MDSLKGERIFQEVIGLFLIALTIFLVISLISYSKNDPCLNVACGGDAAATHTVSNFAGPFGAIVSDIMIRFWGVTAFFIPLVSLFLGLHIMCMKPIDRKWAASLGVIAFLFSMPPLISLLYPFEEISIFGLVLASSGWVGQAVAQDVFVRYLGLPGAYLVLITIWLASIMMITRMSLIRILGGIGYCFRCVINFLRDRLKKKGYVYESAATPAQRTHSRRKPKQEVTEVSHAPVEIEEKPQEPDRHYLLPPFSLLKKAEKSSQKKAEMQREIARNSRLLETKLLDFGVEGKVVQVLPGPVITRYEFEPAPGIKINRIANLSDDLALAMKALSVRIVAPVPGKSVVGLEIPNSKREIVVLRDILSSKEFRHINSKLALALGKDISGKPYVTDLARMPHLLVAGATGSGKSVSVNAIICSILFNATSEDVKFLMIDPKRLELGIYNDIPQLLVPVVMEPRHAANALRWATEEMDQRYRILADKGVRNIDQFNALVESGSFNDAEEEMEKLPYIVIVIDEFADLILIGGREVESLLTRLAQMARAVGIHLVIATQRPSVDIITGLIKANFPCRISFRVSSKTDSRTILDKNGAEKLLGMGDMLFIPPGSSDLRRVHGSSVTEEEIKNLVDFLIQQGPPEYDTSIIQDRDGEAKETGSEEYDELYDQAVDLVVKTNKASISMVQRRLRIGYNRAARMIEIMERDGLVSKPDGSKPRQVLARKENETI